MNSWGITWITSLSAGCAPAVADSITLSKSLCVTSLFLSVIMPCPLRLLIWPPAIPTITLVISVPAIFSASSIACRIDWTVLSIFNTIPLCNPLEGWELTPIISTSPDVATSATKQRIFVVPISSPTIISFCAIFSIIILKIIIYNSFTSFS